MILPPAQVARLESYRFVSLCFPTDPLRTQHPAARRLRTLFAGRLGSAPAANNLGQGQTRAGPIRARGHVAYRHLGSQARGGRRTSQPLQADRYEGARECSSPSCWRRLPAYGQVGHRAVDDPADPGIGNSHPKGSQYIFSGEAPGGPEEMPDISSVVSLLSGTETPYLPSNIMVPGGSEQAAISTVGFLPPAHKVFRTGGNPCDPSWTVPNLGLIGGIDQRRFHDRTDLLSNLDVGIPGAGRVKDVQALRALQLQAEDMLTNPATRRAFDLTSEPQSLRRNLRHRASRPMLPARSQAHRSRRAVRNRRLS